MSNNTVTLDQRSIQSLERMMGKHADELHHMLKNTLGGIGKSGFGGSGLSGVRQGSSMEDTLKELKEFHKSLTRVGASLSATEKYQRDAAKREIDSINSVIKAQEEEKKKRTENTEAIEDNTEAADKQRKHVEEANRRIADMATRAAQGALSFTAVTRAVNEFSQAYKHGLKWDGITDTLTAAFKMGMSPKEMMDFQAQFRRVSNTFSGGVKDFNASIAANQKEWLHYTGSLKDAALAQAQFADVALSIGVNRKEMGSAVDGMFKQFKQLQAVTSQTAEEFVQMQKAMLSDQGIREKLVGLQGKERLNALAGLTQTNIAFQQMGMTKEVAQATISYIQSQSTRKGVDRLKESYQMQAISGILGINSKTAARFQELHSKGPSRFKEGEAEQYATMLQEYRQAAARMKQGSAADEYTIDALIEKMPFLASTSAMDDSVLQTAGGGAQATAIAQQLKDMNANSSAGFKSVVDAIINVSNVFSAWGQSALAAIAGIAVGIAAKKGLFDVLKPSSKAPGTGTPGQAGGKGMFGLSGAGKAGLVGLGLAGVGAAASYGMSDDNPAKDYVGNMSSGAGTGAMIGAIFGPLGMAIGGVAGGLAGGLYTMLSNSEKLSTTLDSQKTALIQQYSAVKTQADFEAASYQKEIDDIERVRKANGQLKDEEVNRLNYLKDMQKKAQAEATRGNAATSAVKMQFDAMGIAQASKGIFDAASGEKTGLSLFSKYGDTNDVLGALGGIRQKMAAAGVNITDEQIRGMMSGSLMNTLAKNNMRDLDSAKLVGAINGTEGNFDFDNKRMNPIIAQAMQDMAPQLNQMMTAQFTESIKNNLTPETIGELRNQLQDLQTKALQEQAAADAYKNSSDSSVQGLGVDAEARAAQAQETARILEQALRAAVPNETAIKGLDPKVFNDMVDLLDTIANGGKKRTPFKNTASSQ